MNIIKDHLISGHYFLRRELGSTNSEAIIVVVDVGDIMLVIINEIFFVDFKIKQLMSAIVVEDVIDSFGSRFECLSKDDMSSFYDGF